MITLSKIITAKIELHKWNIEKYYSRNSLKNDLPPNLENLYKFGLIIVELVHGHHRGTALRYFIRSPIKGLKKALREWNEHLTFDIIEKKPGSTTIKLKLDKNRRN